MKIKAIEEASENNEDDYEIPDKAGFDLRSKSLSNTVRKEVGPKKDVLPMKSIMKDILDKPLSEAAQKVFLL